MKDRWVKNSVVLAVGTGISRVFGLGRDILLALVLGAGTQADVFVAAFRLPNLFRRLFAEGAFAAGFVPVYASMKDAAAAKIFASQILTLVSLFLFVLTLLAEIFMAELVFIIAGGFLADSDKFALAVLCSRIAFPYLIFMFLLSLYGALLNAAGRFWATALVPILLNLCLIAASLFLWFEQTNVEAAALLSASVAGAGVLQGLMMMIAAYRANLLVFPKKITLSGEVRTFLKIILPALAAGGVVQLNIIIGTRIASSEAAAVAKLYYAERLYQLPLAMIGIAIGVALLPALSTLRPSSDSVQWRETLSRALEGAMLLTLPATAGLLVLAQPILAALFEWGAFTAAVRVETALILCAFALGLPAFVAQRILSSAFFANLNTKTPLYFAALALGVNAVLALWWFSVLGAVGIALATAVAAWVSALGLWVVASRGGWLAAGLGLSFLRQGAASLLMAFVLFLWQDFMPLPAAGVGRIAYVAFLLLLGLAVYFILCPALKLIEMKKWLKEFYDR